VIWNPGLEMRSISSLRAILESSFLSWNVLKGRNRHRVPSGFKNALSFFTYERFRSFIWHIATFSDFDVHLTQFLDTCNPDGLIILYTSYLQHFFPVKHSALMLILTEWAEEMTIGTRLFQCLGTVAFFCRERSQTTQFTCHGLSGKYQITCHGLTDCASSHPRPKVLDSRRHHEHIPYIMLMQMTPKSV
jgi:hypothetical protein